MKNYLKVRWVHNNPAYPILILSELDENRFETRKVEVFADGRTGYASEELGVGGVQLGEVALPPEEEIAADPQFSVESMTLSEFDEAWNGATSS